MTCGVIAEKKTLQRVEREAETVALLRKNVPVANIALILGLDQDKCVQTCRQLIKSYKIDYAPTYRAKDTIPYGLTDASAAFRTRLGGYIARMRDLDEMTDIEIARSTGLPARCQKRAMDGSIHDWKTSELERLARAQGRSFKELMIKALFTAADIPLIVSTLREG